MYPKAHTVADSYSTFFIDIELIGVLGPTSTSGKNTSLVGDTHNDSGYRFVSREGSQG
jgi:hypothetical protein